MTSKIPVCSILVISLFIISMLLPPTYPAPIINAIVKTRRKHQFTTRVEIKNPHRMRVVSSGNGNTMPPKMRRAKSPR
jgi:hypothetical protein